MWHKQMKGQQFIFDGKAITIPTNDTWLRKQLHMKRVGTITGTLLNVTLQAMASKGYPHVSTLSHLAIVTLLFIDGLDITTALLLSQGQIRHPHFTKTNYFSYIQMHNEDYSNIIIFKFKSKKNTELHWSLNKQVNSFLYSSGGVASGFCGLHSRSFLGAGTAHSKQAV